MKKIGTLRCKLFGHKFSVWSITDEKLSDGRRKSHLKELEFCLNCGIKYEDA